MGVKVAIVYRPCPFIFTAYSVRMYTDCIVQLSVLYMQC